MDFLGLNNLNVEEDDDESDHGEDSPTLGSTCSSSSEDEAIANLRMRRKKMPNGEDFRLETNMANPPSIIEHIVNDGDRSPNIGHQQHTRAPNSRVCANSHIS
ncbi:unnamed protein product [Prunus armeniaca]